jgi:hypothetical protein
MYFRDRESDPKAAAAHNKNQRTNAKDRLKTVASKKKLRKAK